MEVARMIEFAAWLDDMSAKPLPAGVAAAAVAAAMGVALVAKTLRVTLRRQALAAARRATLQATLELAHEQRGLLLELAEADQKAFRAVLELNQLEAQDREKQDAWQAATEVPLRIAEACQALLAKLPPLIQVCWPAVSSDLRTGVWLLEAGLHGCLLAAECNLQVIGEDARAQSLRGRMDALKDERND
jgi:formiminotetrahydrofolate cyclodeaminase